MLQEINDHDFAEVFGEGTGGNCTPIIPTRIPGENCSLDGFTREDVAEIKGLVHGENDGDEWAVWGLLNDGRYFIAAGSCDYTGWACQAYNQGNVAETEQNLIRYAMSDNERTRFGITLDS